MKAYAACLSATSTRESPWYVVPADDKANARLIISQIVLDALQDLKIEYPRLSAAQQKELREIRKLLAE
jgi:Polyphosphate kinase 2 (PPK2)